MENQNNDSTFKMAFLFIAVLIILAGAYALYDGLNNQERWAYAVGGGLVVILALAGGAASVLIIQWIDSARAAKRDTVEQERFNSNVKENLMLMAMQGKAQAAQNLAMSRQMMGQSRYSPALPGPDGVFFDDNLFDTKMIEGDTE